MQCYQSSPQACQIRTLQSDGHATLCSRDFCHFVQARVRVPFIMLFLQDFAPGTAPSKSPRRFYFDAVPATWKELEHCCREDCRRRVVRFLFLQQYHYFIHQSCSHTGPFLGFCWDVSKEFPTTVAYRKKYVLSVYFLTPDSYCPGLNSTRLTPEMLEESSKDFFLCWWSCSEWSIDSSAAIVFLQDMIPSASQFFGHRVNFGASIFLCKREGQCLAVNLTIPLCVSLWTYKPDWLQNYSVSNPRMVKSDLSSQHVYIEDGTHQTREAAFKHYHFTMFCGDFSTTPFPPLALVYSLAYVAHALWLFWMIFWIFLDQFGCLKYFGCLLMLQIYT